MMNDLVMRMKALSINEPSVGIKDVKYQGSFLSNLQKIANGEKKLLGVPSNDNVFNTSTVLLSGKRNISPSILPPSTTTSMTTNVSVRQLVKEEVYNPENELEELLGKTRSLINKVTLQAFEKALIQMKSLKIDSQKKLTECIDVIFVKALSEPNSSFTYAKLCKELSNTPHLQNVCWQIADGDEKYTSENNSISFRKVLLKKCQNEFQKDFIDDREINKVTKKRFESEEKKLKWLEELNQKKKINRRRKLTNIKFIGELFSLGMISETTIHNKIISKLLYMDKKETFENQLECLCILLFIIGRKLDQATQKLQMDKYFCQIQRIITKSIISTHLKIALQEIVELRLNNWIPCCDECVPKIIDDIYGETLKKKSEEANQGIQSQLVKRLRNREAHRALCKLSRRRTNELT